MCQFMHSMSYRVRDCLLAKQANTCRTGLCVVPSGMDATEASTAPPLDLEPLLERLDSIIAPVAARCVAEIPAYQSLPASVTEDELPANLRATVEVVIRVLTERRTLTDRELTRLVSWGAERARDGLPLEAVLRIYPIAAKCLFNALISTSTPDQYAVIARLAPAVFDHLAMVQPQVATAYLEERDGLDWEHRELRQHLAGALLAGRTAYHLAARSDRTLAERYDVVVFRIPALPIADDPRGTTKRFRAIQDRLDTDHEVLASFERDGGILLIPAPGREGVSSRVSDILEHIDAATDSRCTAGVAGAADHAQIPAAHQQAGELLDLALRLRRPPGLYWLSDLAIDYQLARPSAARTCLANTLASVVRHPHLIEALRAYFDNDFQRSTTAAALTIHRNTLNYRLHRIHTLTGYNPTNPTDARHLVAALTAHDTINGTPT